MKWLTPATHNVPFHRLLRSSAFTAGVCRSVGTAAEMRSADFVSPFHLPFRRFAEHANLLNFDNYKRNLKLRCLTSSLLFADLRSTFRSYANKTLPTTSDSVWQRFDTAATRQKRFLSGDHNDHQPLNLPTAGKAEERPGCQPIHDDDNDNASYSDILKSLSPFLWPENRAHRLRVIGSAAALTLSKLSTITAPLLLSKAVNRLTAERDFTSVAGTHSPVAALVAGYGILRMLSSGFGELRNGLFARVSHSGARAVACSAFLHLHSLDLDFLLTSKSGELSVILSRGTKAVTQLLSMMLFQVVPTIFEFCLVMSVLIHKVDVRVAIVTALSMLSYGYFTATLTTRRTGFRKDMNMADQRANGYLLDSIANAEAVRHNTNERFELERYQAERLKVERASVKVQQSLSWLNFGQQLIFNCGLLGSLLLTASQIRAEKAPVGHMVLVGSLLFQLAVPLNFFGTVFRETTLNLIDMRKLYQLLQMEANARNNVICRDFNFVDGSIALKDVSFRYKIPKARAKVATDAGQATEELDVFTDVTIEIPGGKKVAIVGPSGGGKSTVIKLICRLYNPSSGSVIIDGQDVKHLDTRSFRQHIGVVPQDVVLFNESVLFNLAYGNPRASFDEIVKAAKIACIHDTIEAMPLGYNTIVGERGLKLSGGEKQRIGIARCILRRPNIFLFDEATSSLDVNTEKKIMKKLKESMSNHTAVVVAHRLSTIMDADLIYYVDNGKIMETGTFSQLLINNGPFAAVWRRQAMPDPKSKKKNEV